MHSHGPTHQGLERIVLIAAFLGRIFRTVIASLAINQRPAGKPSIRVADRT